MLQDMDSMEASCIIYVKVGMFTHLEQCHIWILSFNKTGIVRRTIQNDGTLSVRVMYYPGDYSKQTSADILSLEE